MSRVFRTAHRLDVEIHWPIAVTCECNPRGVWRPDRHPLVGGMRSESGLRSTLQIEDPDITRSYARVDTEGHGVTIVRRDAQIGSLAFLRGEPKGFPLRSCQVSVPAGRSLT